MANIPNTWRRVAGQRIRHLSAEAAKTALDAIRAQGLTVEQPTIRELTGGYCSQSINAHVTRRLAVRAGLIKDMK
jgi:hypothetical protein